MADNMSLLELRKNYWRKIRHPFTGGFEITPYCNFKCIHCYMSDYPNIKLLTTNEIKLILDKLFDKGVLFIYFTGGEILTRPDFCEIFIYAKKKGFIVELLTNSSLLTEKIADMFVEYPPANVSISVYGANNETYKRVTGRDGMFDRVLKSLNMLNERQIHFEIKFIVLRENVSDFNEVKQLADNFGCRFIHTCEAFPTLNGGLNPVSHMLSLEEIIEFERHYEKTANTWASCMLNLKQHTPKDVQPLFMCYVRNRTYKLPC